uniref:ABC transmembrane type-1 domain-containing protein n=1 Tax=Loa loa TaxID=7209 RepID=A0A1I7VT02_LOALO
MGAVATLKRYEDESLRNLRSKGEFASELSQQEREESVQAAQRATVKLIQLQLPMFSGILETGEHSAAALKQWYITRTFQTSRNSIISFRAQEMKHYKQLMDTRLRQRITILFERYLWRNTVIRILSQVCFATVFSS